MENIRIETSVRRLPHATVLDVIGEIDIYTTPQFKDAINAAISEGKPALIVNLKLVSYMDSSGFGALLSATKRLRPMQGTLAIVGCNESITRMLQITRLNTIFGVYHTELEALQAIEAETVVGVAV